MTFTRNKNIFLTSTIDFSNRYHGVSIHAATNPRSARPILPIFQRVANQQREGSRKGNKGLGLTYVGSTSLFFLYPAFPIPDATPHTPTLPPTQSEI